MAVTCAVKDCSNGTYWLNKWKKQLCDFCGCLHKEKNCKCDPPFRLFTFPTSKKDPERRARWKQLIGRKDGNKLWSPSKDSRVCSEHFVNGEQTLQNSLPTLKLGYKGFEERVRRINFFSTRPAHPIAVIVQLQDANMKIRKEEETTEDPSIEIMERNMCTELPWHMWFICLLLCLLKVLTEYQKKITDLTREVEKLKAQV